MFEEKDCVDDIDESNIEEDDDKLSFDIEEKNRNRILRVNSYDYSVEFLNSLIDSKRIILDVSFQRNPIWGKDMQSSLIESILLNVPIPPLYFCEEKNGTWLVIDGLQRLTSIHDFINNKFYLNNLEALKSLNKQKFSSLCENDKNSFLNSMFRVVVIQKDSNENIKYDVFVRLNKGGIKLNFQEIRNCLYRGNLNDAAKEICLENDKFKRILNQKQPNKRFQDVELVLRCLTISKLTNFDENKKIFYLNNDYKGSIAQSINSFMEKNKNCSLEEKNNFKKSFNETINKILLVFNENEVFRNPKSDTKKISKPICDFLYPSFERLDYKIIDSNKKEMKELFNEMFINKDKLFNGRSSEKANMNFRLEYWSNLIRKFL